MSSEDCIAAVRRAAPNLTDDEIDGIFTAVQAERKRLIAEGSAADIDQKMRAFARAEGQKARVAAMLERRNAALAAIARDRLDLMIQAHVSAGLSYPRAVLAVLEGTARGIREGRKSVAAHRLAYESRYVSDMMATLQRDHPHMVHLLGDQVFLGDVVREMFELRDGGTPGLSGNRDARAAAGVFAAYAETSRRDLNRLGANIGRLDGWAGPQAHDPYKLLGVTEDQWIAKVMGRLDLDRTFGRDQARLDQLGAEHAKVKAEIDAARLELRTNALDADRLGGRIADLERRRAVLDRAREMEAARLSERQGEMGAQTDRYVGNLEREQDGRIQLQMEGRDAAAERHSLRRREAARENTAALNRLRRRAETAHDTIARIEGRAAQLDDRIARLRAMADELARRAEAPRARLPEIEARLKELDIARAELRPAVDDPVEFLRQVYRTVTTGRDTTISAQGRGEVTGPANLAKSLGKHRVLHFKSADDWLAYNAEFGHGDIFSAMIAHQHRAARLAAQMKVLGPNPEAMMASLLEGLQIKVRNDPRIPAADKEGIIRSLTTDPGSRIGSALAEVRGLTLAPGDITWAKIGAGIRAGQSLSKLGVAVVSSISDLATSAAALKFHGKPLGAVWADQLGELFKGRGRGEQKELAYLVGEGFDGLIGQIVTPHVAGDGVPGAISRSMETFFRWSGLTAWTDARRAGAARMLSAWMGTQAEHAWADLNRRFRHGLTLHGIDAAQWEALRQTRFVAENGRRYVTPDRVAGLSDDVVARLIPADDVTRARAAFKVDETTMRQFDRDAPVPPDLAASRLAKFEAWMERRRADARQDLEMAARRYFADEVNFAVIETDDQTRRQLYWGTRPGTMVGEALRFMMQFKGFPLAFTNRVLGRALLGGEGDTAAGRLLNNAGHIGHLMAATMVAGYMVLVAKDTLRGWWPPRDPTDPKTWLAALAQGGGAGIYGDYLFGQASRFGNRPLETLAGPTAGAAAGLIDLWMKARDGEARAGDAFNIALQNTPFVNLFYVRPGLDFLVLNSLHDSMSPGYLMRQERARRREMGQQRLWDAEMK